MAKALDGQKDGQNRQPESGTKNFTELNELCDYGGNTGLIVHLPRALVLSWGFVYAASHPAGNFIG